jgi:triacylglycerol lipase
MTEFVKFPLEKIERDAFEAFSATSDFRLGNARALMWVSQLVYQTDDLPALGAVVNAWGFLSLEKFVRGDLTRMTTGVYGVRNDAVILAFAGTDPGILQTVITDAQARRNGDDIHEGFQEAIVAAKDDAQAAADLAAASGKPLFVTGHSLGGALAALAAKYCASRGVTPFAVYTFGMPRVGGERFAREYNSSYLGAITYRLVHGDDIIPRVPPSQLGYRHVGRVLQCATEGKFASPANLSAVGSDEPSLASSILGGIGGYAANILAGKFLGRPGPMPGPIGEAFRLLPPQIRHHLQDYYLDALKP